MNRVITLNWFESSKRLEEASRLQRKEELDQQSLGQSQKPDREGGLLWKHALPDGRASDTLSRVAFILLDLR